MFGRHRALFLFVSLLLACEGDSGPGDENPDGGSALVDSGAPPRDSGTPRAGSGAEAGSGGAHSDAGTNTQRDAAAQQDGAVRQDAAAHDAAADASTDGGDEDEDAGSSCGNGVVDADEQCDGTPVFASCLSLGLGGGHVGCDAECRFDLSACVACGNGAIDGSEACDGADFGGLTCASFGFGSGELDCRSSCTIDTSDCSRCGNGTIDDLAEECDGADLDGKTCRSMGFLRGTLACGDDCRLDSSGCARCGNGVIDDDEVCDGNAFGGATCASFGFSAGLLACSAGCDAIETDACYDAENCANAEDDDGDGYFDCQDGDCFDACNDACFAAPIPLAVPSTVSGDTTDHSMVLVSNLCSAGTGREVIYEVTMPYSGRIRATLTPTSGANLGLYVGGLCNGPEIDCTFGSGPQVLEMDLPGGLTGWLAVDGQNEFDQGSYALAIEMLTPRPSESCDQNVDADGDGLAGCADPDCTGACADACAAPVMLAVEDSVEGDTTGHAQTADGSCQIVQGGGGGRDIAYAVQTRPQTDRLLVALYSDADLGLFARGTCGSWTSELACADDDFGPGAVESLEVDVDGGEIVNLFVAGFGPLDEGAFQLIVHEVVKTEAACDDGSDDDFDGAVDCLDEDCATACCGNGTLEAYEQCDGADLDGANCETYGYDGGELGCTACAHDTALCILIEHCANGQDDDQDGDADCDDPDCGGECADACDPPAELALGEYVSAQTIGRGDRAAGSCQDDPSGADVAYAVQTRPRTDSVQVRLSSPADLGVFVRAQCGDGSSEIACADDTFGSGEEVLNIDVDGGELLYVFVGGRGPADEGQFVLTVNETVKVETACSDGVDDDLDGQTDCADDNCFAACCGNGQFDPGETCEGAEIGSATCVSYGFGGGTLGCNDACEHDTTQCRVEACDNGQDDDLDGETDCADADCGTSIYYADFDSDGFGDAFNTVQAACPGPIGYVANAIDCNDFDPSAYPSGIEVCDFIDNDCDFATDEQPVDAPSWYADSDGDGFGDAFGQPLVACQPPFGLVQDASDCDDDNISVYPGAAEYCNDFSDDCDAAIDENPVDPEVWYADGDEDGYGDMEQFVQACSQPEDHVKNWSDCDDESSTVHPEAAEVCNTGDDDCDGTTDEGACACSDALDNDGDGQTDHPWDPGCASRSDADETDPEVAPQCSDGVDNDGDGATDFGDDAGCTAAGDDDEACTPFGTVDGYTGCADTGIVPCDDLTLTGSNGCSGDDCITTLALPFAFTYFGVSQTSVSLIANGKLGFPGASTYTNSCTIEANTAAVYWDDLYPPGGGSLRYETLGTAPNRRMVFQWNVPHIAGQGSGDLLDVRAVLYETTNVIDFCYVDTESGGSDSDHGQSATIGIRGGGEALTYSCNTPSVPAGTWLRFTPQ